jgi:hypothetical protein
MVQANIYFSQEEDEIIHTLSKRWNLNKNETVKKIVRAFKEELIS